MTSIPFTVYDIFAYLSAGSLLLFTIDYAYGSKILLSESLSLTIGILFLFAAYICGHVVAGLSEPILQGIVTRKWIGIPSEILMGVKTASITRRIFPFYCRPLPESTQTRVRAQASARGFSGSGETLFLHTFSIVCQSDTERKRLDEFRNLYGFSRNVAFSLFMGSIILTSAIRFTLEQIPTTWPIMMLIAGIAMFARFLKFYRQYTYQLLITYAELAFEKPSKEKRQ